MGETRRRRGVAAAAATSLVLALFALSGTPARAAGAGTGVFGGHTMSGGAVPCAPQAGGVRVCAGDEHGVGKVDLRLKSFDGTPLQFFVTLPPKPASGPDGRYPLVVQSHGWGDPPTGPNDGQYGGPTALAWARDGYAVLQLSARGWGDSCGSVASRLVDLAACAAGYVHLDDYRYEARDVQHAVGLLVDEGLVDPNRIGATGESYGGGVTLELATLKDRVMDPDGTLRPWTSPGGIPLHVAAAAPYATWSDLVYALLPNGRTLANQVTSATADLSPPGVEKTSIVSGLYLVGTEQANYAPPLSNPQADLTTWFTQITAGEPYTTPVAEAMIQKIAKYRSPYYLLDGAYGFAREEPPPLFLANGFTDDVFPADEVLRYYNLERALYPNAPIGVFLADVGHQRANNKPADGTLLVRHVKAFFDHYLKGTGPAPRLGVTALTQACPTTVASAGPYHASSWTALHPGQVAHTFTATRTVLSTGGNPLVSKAFDPVFGGLACTTAPANDSALGVATYSLPAATGKGYTLLGAPTITADLHATGVFPYLAARLVDVDPANGTQTLVARGLYRLDPNAPNGRQTFQLHPGAWHFAAGHVPRLELLGLDVPYARPVNGAFAIAVSNLQLQLPVHEVPGAPGTPAVVQRASAPSGRATAPPQQRTAAPNPAPQGAATPTPAKHPAQQPGGTPAAAPAAHRSTARTGQLAHTGGDPSAPALAAALLLAMLLALRWRYRARRGSPAADRV